MNKPRVSDEQLVRVLGVCRRENAGFDDRYVPLVDLLADLRDCRAALAQEREAREQRESDEARLGLVAAEWKPRAERAEAACARMREALQGALRGVGPMILTEIVADIRDALASDAGEKAAAVIRAAREWRRSRRTGAEDWPASVDLAAAIDALDAEREEK